MVRNPGKKHFGTLFQKYLVYYLLILAIPVVILGIGISAFIYRFNTNQTARHNEKFSYLVRSVFDENFNSIHAVNEALLLDTASEHWQNGGTYYDAYLERRNLSNLKKTAIPFAENIILLRPGTSRILSSSSTYSAKYFYGVIYRSSFSMETLTTGASVPRILPIDSNGQSMIGYALPGSRTPSRSVNLYTIPHSHFDNLLKQSALAGSQIYLSDDENNILYHYGDGASAAPDVLLSSSHLMWMDGRMYLMTNLPSNATPLNYTVLTPVFTEFQDLVLLVFLFLVCTTLVLISGFALSYHLAKKTTRPIETLSTMAHKQIGSVPTQGDELATLSLAFNQMNERIDHLKNVIENTNDDVIYINIMKLLTGEVSSLEQINRVLASQDIQLSQKYYTVAVFDCDAPPSRKRRMSGLTYKEDRVGDETIQLFFLNSYDTRYIYALIVTPTSTRNLRQYLVDTSRRLFQMLASDITIGYAGSHFYFSEISTHFHECLLALDYQFLRGKGELLDFREIQRVEQLDYQTLDYQKFYHLILNGSAEEVLSYVHDYYTHISSGAYFDLQAVKVRVYGLFNFLYDTFPTLVADYQNSGTRLEHNETAEDFLNYICYLSLFLQERLQKSHTDDKFAQISQFIAENFQNESFSIQWVADHFGMSMSSLSKYYKSIAGTNISETVNKLKMEKSIELLTQTDLTINEIVSALGYSNASSFIRKFKEYTAVTPGRYRELHRNHTQN